MKRRIELRLLSTAVLIISVFFLSGCYTQLAKPESRHVEPDETEYYVEDDSEEYVEGEEEYAYEEDEEGEYHEDHEGEVQVTHEIHHDVHYYGYNRHSWVYDPFFDPYFYDSYTPYTSRVSVRVGYYDPFYRDPFFYDPFFYGSVYACDPYWYFGSSNYFGYYRRPFRRYGSYYPGYYYPGYSGGVVVNTVPSKRRGFTRRGSRRTDNFGYEPDHVAVNSTSPLTSRAARIGRTMSGSSDVGSDRRRKIKRTKLGSGKIERRGEATTSETARRGSRRKRYSTDDVASNPEARPVTSVKSEGRKKGQKIGRSTEERRSRGRITRRPKSDGQSVSTSRPSKIKNSRSSSVKSKKEAKVRSRRPSSNKPSNVRTVSGGRSSGSSKVKSSGRPARSSGSVRRSGSSGSVQKSRPSSGSKSSGRSSGRRTKKQ